MIEIVFSDASEPLEWSEARSLAHIYGPKAANCLALPRAWTLPFALLSAASVKLLAESRSIIGQFTEEQLAKLIELGGNDGKVIVRSSVIGETIWERGTYISIVSDVAENGARALDNAIREVISSTAGKSTGIMIQHYLDASFQGEFGNLQRISKTRDHWELSLRDRSATPTRLRLNSQRDTAADASLPIRVRSGVRTERLFGPIAAWLNNELLRGKSHRVNCEWVTDNRYFWIVQVDEEDEDACGVNPFQLRVSAFIRPKSGNGRFLRAAEGSALSEWDKLKVLKELWEEGAPYRPTLFYVELSSLPVANDEEGMAALIDDFRTLIGPSGIVVRTSVRADDEKITNLPRTDCLTPEQAAKWCVHMAREVAKDGVEFAFVAHRFVASRASAWVRAEPGNPMVEIHALWGLPDALQYCPYDIWEVHVPTGVATEYPEYKSDMLVAREDGGWEYARIKNELGRANSIRTAEAKDVAARSLAISERLQRPIHVMWFIGCMDGDGFQFNIPWYWTESHPAERNSDRAAYNVLPVKDEASLEQFRNWKGPRHRQALALKPTDLGLMRDNKFLGRVGAAARDAEVPVILFGSTLAHAYYQLRKEGCAVITPSEKDHTRIRRTAQLGKLVRDKIPSRIAARQEIETTKEVPDQLRKGYLIGKLLEEAMEVREAATPDQKREELGDLYEVLRALALSESVSLEEVLSAANTKREKAGGFERGLVLLQTGIAKSDRTGAAEGLGQLLGLQTADDTVELPFSFFGFMELDQPRSILLEQYGIRLEISLRADRIEVRVSRPTEQLGLPLSDGAGE